MTAINTLAKEIGARVKNGEPDFPAISLFVVGLLKRLSATVSHGLPHPIRQIADTMAWAIEKSCEETYDLLRIAHGFEEIIEAVDDDDGWPADVHLDALKACCLALEFAIKDGARSRWSAEAGMRVHGCIAGFKFTPDARRVFLQTVLRQARATADGTSSLDDEVFGLLQSSPNDLEFIDRVQQSVRRALMGEVDRVSAPPREKSSGGDGA